MLPYLLIWEALYRLKKFMCVLCDIFPSNLFFYNWCSDIFNDNFLIKQLGTYLWAELKYEIQTFHSLTRDVSVHCPLMMFKFSERLIISAICKTTIRSQYLLKYFHVSNTIVSISMCQILCWRNRGEGNRVSTIKLLKSRLYGERGYVSSQSHLWVTQKVYANFFFPDGKALNKLYLKKLE